jgi:DNA replication protein DnaC
MNAAHLAQLRANLKSLHLAAMAGQLDSLLRQAREGSQDPAEFLLNLTELEISTRRENGCKRRIQDARFPLLKPIESFRFDAAPQLDLRLVKELLSGQYIADRRNVIFMGKSGTGKTHLAIALGMAACAQGIRTRFTTGCTLANELIEARDERSLKRTINRYFSYGLLIVDELGYVPFSKEGAELLFQVLAERHERKPVVITTNLGFADWTRIFGEPALTAALLDRITHRAHIFNCSWESFRLKDTLSKKKPQRSAIVQHQEEAAASDPQQEP